VSYHPTPPEKIRIHSTWDIGIEETRGAPRPWIFERKEARRRQRALALARIRTLLGKVTLSRSKEVNGPRTPP
jgi:hypothetical protein